MRHVFVWRLIWLLTYHVRVSVGRRVRRLMVVELLGSCTLWWWHNIVGAILCEGGLGIVIIIIIIIRLAFHVHPKQPQHPGRTRTRTVSPRCGLAVLTQRLGPSTCVTTLQHVQMPIISWSFIFQSIFMTYEATIKIKKTHSNFDRQRRQVFFKK